MSALHYLYGAAAEGHLAQISREQELNDIAVRVDRKVSGLNQEIAQLREIVRSQQAAIDERDAFIDQAITQSKEKEAIIREMQREVRRFNAAMDVSINDYLSSIDPEASPLADALVDMLQVRSGEIMAMSANKGRRAEFVQLFNDQLRRFAEKGEVIGEQEYIRAGNLAYALLENRVIRDIMAAEKIQAQRNTGEDPAARRAREREERARLARIKNDGIF